MSVSERALEKLVQQQPESAGFLGGAHGVLELAENLRLAQHHRVEPARYAERVFDRPLMRQLVDVRFEVLGFQLVIVGKPVQRPPRLRRVAIDFRAVARGNYRGFRDRIAVNEVAQRLHQVFGMKNHLLAQRKRRSLVVDTESKELHRLEAVSLRSHGSRKRGL